jgi:glycosyltransferase involved in cell wall biosynthesis
MPRVSVLMPVYNAAPYLKEAIDSIVGQTYNDFELLVIDDGSTDNSAELIASCPDHRIRLLRQPVNKGIVAALNMGINLAEGEYLIRMDADDISLPERFAIQVGFMDANPMIGVCGSCMEVFSEKERAVWSPPFKHEEIFSNLLFESVLYHPTVIMRTALLKDNDLSYDDGYRHAEDYNFWTRCAKVSKLANIDEVLVRYRHHSESVGSREKPSQLASAARVREGLLIEMGIKANVRELAVHQALALWRAPSGLDFLDEALTWLLRLCEVNSKCKMFPEPAFSEVIGRRWYHACSQSANEGVAAYNIWKNSLLYSHCSLFWRHRFLFMIRCLSPFKQSHRWRIT